MLKKFLLIGTAAVALGAVSLQARADNIVTNQWYSGGFTGTPSPLVGPFATGTNGPVLPNPNKANALPTPTSGGLLTAIITLPHGGKLLVTDVEASGDQFVIDRQWQSGNKCPRGFHRPDPRRPAVLGCVHVSAKFR